MKNKNLIRMLIFYFQLGAKMGHLGKVNRVVVVAAGAAFGLMHGKWPATSELAGVTAEPHAIDAKKKYT